MNAVSTARITGQPRIEPAAGPHLLRIVDFDHPASGPRLAAITGDCGTIGHIQLHRDTRGWMLRAGPGGPAPLVGGLPTRARVVRDGDVIVVDRAAYLLRTQLRRRGRASLPGLFTLHPALAATYARLAKLATSSVSVVITGETGTGKELTARALHRASGRPGRFVALNCGALPDTLVESELFGSVRGAFSSADADRPGLFRSAHGGTLFLDEIAELSMRSQVALLRVLQEREVRPIGAALPVRVDVRVVCATHRDLPARVADGTFREDLYARLAGYTAAIVPLRDRIDDFGIIVADLLRKLAPEDADSIRLDSSAGRALLAHRWPRNVRELESALHTAIVLADGRPIALDHLPAAVREPERAPATKLSARERAQRDRMVDAIATSLGNVTAAAQILGCSRSHFHKLLNKYGATAAEFRGAR